MPFCCLSIWPLRYHYYDYEASIVTLFPIWSPAVNQKWIRGLFREARTTSFTGLLVWGNQNSFLHLINNACLGQPEQLPPLA